MATKRVVVGLLVVIMFAACGGTASPPASADPVAAASSPASNAPSAASPSPPATPTAKPTSTPTVASTSDSWPTFTSEAIRYSIQHPPDWAVEAGPADGADYYYSMTDLYPHVHIHRDASGPVDVDATVAGAQSFYEKEYEGAVVSNTEITLDGHSGRLLVIEAMENKIRVTIRWIIVAKGDVGYLITWFGWRSETDPDGILFEKFYSSWRAG